MSEEDARLYQYYKDQGRQFAAEGNIRAAIKATKKAYAIHASDKIKRRIEKLKAFLKETEDIDYDESAEPSDQEENNDDENERPNGNQASPANDSFSLPKKLYSQLYSYQKGGVQWLWHLHKQNKGGVIGDDMGLGKTIQIIAFLSGLFEKKMIRSAFIIMPVSLITNWCNEFSKWAPSISVTTFHSESKSQRERNLCRVQRHTGVLITSYGMVVSNVDLFKMSRGQPFIWDYVILDEGHKIKNPTKTTKAVHEIPAKHRLVLTGTPIQNNLKELWALYDFCHQGTLLGSLPTFKMQYETIITRSREKNATSGEKKLGNMMADSLRHLIAPYFLRRTKQEVIRQMDRLTDKENEDPSAAGNSKKMAKLPQKNELIVWLHLSDTQIQIYDDFLKTDQVKDLLMTKKSPLVALTVLKKICDHPRLLSVRACLQLGMNGEINQQELEEILADEETTAPSIDVDHHILLKESGKLSILLELLERLRTEGHRTLIFSQSRKMLDIINNILLARDWKVIRLDGTIKKLDEREGIVRRFQSSNMYSVMLLTTQVGGVGLTLTAADRVIIYDPSWNPATDAQAVDRAYRIGQTKPVVVYRLITCGTVEEKIYRRQIFKDSITRKTTGASEDPHRYFTNMELRELFRLDDPRFSSTQRQLEEMHAHQRRAYPELTTHIDYIHTLDIFGISDHDLMFQGQIKDSDDAEESNALHDQQFIQSRVEKARMLLQLESEHAHNENVRSGTYCKDLTNFQKPSRPIVPPAARVEEDNRVFDPSDSPPGTSGLADESCINLDATSASVEELTEEEIEDMKNVSMTDPAFAKALEVSLREYKSRVSVGFPVKKETTMSEIKIESKPQISQPIPAQKEPEMNKEYKAGISQGTPVKNEPTVYRLGQEYKPEPALSEMDELNKALQLSLKEYKEFESQQNSQADVNEAEDEDFKKALQLSLLENLARQEEDELTRVLELSQMEAELHGNSSDDYNYSSTVDRPSSEVFKTPELDLRNLSQIDQDFAEAIELSMREHSPVKNFKVDNASPVEVKKAHRRSEIIVVDSDLDDTDVDDNYSLPDLDHPEQLTTFTTKSLLVKTPQSKSHPSIGQSKRISNIDETDEDEINITDHNPSLSLDESVIQPVKTYGRRRLDSDDESNSLSSSQSDTSRKRSRLTSESDLSREAYESKSISIDQEDSNIETKDNHETSILPSDDQEENSLSGEEDSDDSNCLSFNQEDFNNETTDDSKTRSSEHEDSLALFSEESNNESDY